MSFTIKRREVETLDLDLDYDDFNSINNRNTLFADNNGNIHFDVEELHNDPHIKNNRSILGKRKLADAFGEEFGDQERYGQKISDDFFKTNISHTVVQKREEKNNSDEILNWCYKYLASKNIFN